MRIETWPIERPKPYTANPRVIDDDAVEQVADSIREFGFNVPIVVDADGVIVTGHTRLRAAAKLKLREVPVVVADHLTLAQAKAYRLADNRVAEATEWDQPKLLAEIESLLAEEVEPIGFDDPDIERLRAGIDLYSDVDPSAFAPAPGTEQGRLDKKNACICPKCGHAFTP